MIIEVPSDRNKVDLAAECSEELEKKFKMWKVLVLSIATSTLLYIALGMLLGPNILFQSFIPVGIFFVTSMFYYIILSNPLTSTAIYSKYIVIINRENLIIRFINIKNMETIYTQPILKIGGFGISEKIIKLKCGKMKIPFRGKVIELYSKSGRKIFEFGFWLHELDAQRLYEEIIASVPIMLSKA
ncbi:MAG: hypothetical protein ACP6IP_08855 [Candidatus Njordarchaeia archaeon]